MKNENARESKTINESQLEMRLTGKDNGMNLMHSNIGGLDIYRCGDVSVYHSNVADVVSVRYSYANLIDVSARVIYARRSSVDISGCKAHTISVDCITSLIEGECQILVLAGMMQDPRGYVMDVHMKGDQTRFVMGCRDFSYEEAISHWGGDSYECSIRGRMIANFIDGVMSMREHYTSRVKFV